MALELVNRLPYDHPYRWDGTAVGGQKLWRPDELGASLALWLDAEDAASITLNGSTVSQWDDKSGNGRNATQAAAANQPAYNTSAINGKPAVVTVNNVALYVASWGAVSQPFTRVMVFNPVTIAGGTHLINSATVDVPTSLAANVADYFVNTSNITQYAGTASVNYVPVAIDTTYIRLSEYATTNSSVYTNGTQTGPANGGANSIQGMTIGGYSVSGSGAPVAPTNLRFGEILLISNTMTTADRQKLEGYLAWKWGLAANLPPDHPYRVDGSFFGFGTFDGLFIPAGSDLLATSDGDVFIVQ